MTKITDNIDSDWIVKTNNMAVDFENGLINITDFTNDQLHHLIYFNWGYSGPSTNESAIIAENELIARGCPYNDELGDEIELACSWHYGYLN